MSRSAALACALVVSSPSLYEALWTQTIAVETAVIRFLIALVIHGLVLYAHRNRVPEPARVGVGTFGRVAGRLRGIFKEFF